MSHHGEGPFDAYDEETQKRMRKLLVDTFRKANVGPTGEFPEGKMSEHDEGEARVHAWQRCTVGHEWHLPGDVQTLCTAHADRARRAHQSHLAPLRSASRSGVQFDAAEAA